MRKGQTVKVTKLFLSDKPSNIRLGMTAKVVKKQAVSALIQHKDIDGFSASMEKKGNCWWMLINQLELVKRKPKKK